MSMSAAATKAAAIALCVCPAVPVAFPKQTAHVLRRAADHLAPRPKPHHAKPQPVVSVRRDDCPPDLGGALGGGMAWQPLEPQDVRLPPERSVAGRSPFAHYWPGRYPPGAWGGPIPVEGGGGGGGTITPPPGPVPGGSATPDPATWALMVAGFAMTGVALRRRLIAKG